MRIDRQAHRADIAAVPVAHQLFNKELTVHRQRDDFRIEREARELPPVALDGIRGKADCGHLVNEGLYAGITVDVEVLLHADREGAGELGMAG